MQTIKPNRLMCLILVCLHASCADNQSNDVSTVDVASDVGNIADVANNQTESSALDSGVDAGLDSLVPLEPCEPTVPPAATLRPGIQADGRMLSVTGREIGQLGTMQSLEGFPSNLLVHPARPVIYVTSTSHDDRRLYTLTKEELVPVQDLEPGDVYAGLALSADGNSLYVSGGDAGVIYRYPVDSEGLLGSAETIPVDGYVSYLSLDLNREILWYTRWDQPLLEGLSLATETVVHSLELPKHGWQLLQKERQLFVSMIADEGLWVIDLDNGEQQGLVELAAPVSSLCDMGTHLVAALSASDQVARIRLSGDETPTYFPVATDLSGSDGELLKNSNVNAVFCDTQSNRVYASRGADNLIAVLDGETFAILGLIPTGAYPTQLAGDTGQQKLWMTEGKGGTAPSGGRVAKKVIFGAVRALDLAEVMLSDATELAKANFRRPDTVFPFECDGFFPVPTRTDRRSPIEHIILVVKENKTFDCVFGDLDPNRADVDPSLTIFGREVTPNLHALAEQFALSDNFYTEVEDSDIGHILLTATHLTEYVERIWIEKDHSDQIPEGYQVTAPAVPKVGNFFTHLMNNGISLRIMGELVGVNVDAKDDLGQPAQYIDNRFPGGSFVNYRVKDEEKARRLASIIEAGMLPQFTYILLPNDHTVGTRSGYLTPESMVSDNDYAVGIIVEAISHSPYWSKSAVIILQDDPQGCRDHVDVHRSPLLVVSPWARRNYVSHARASFMSVFNTMERIFGIPPLGRGDATTAPLWDMFIANANQEPFRAIPRQIPDTYNASNAIGAALSSRMDFRGPDRNPALGPLLEVYMAHRKGLITRSEAESKLENMTMNFKRWLTTIEESVEEVFSFDHAVKAYHQYLDKNGIDAQRYPEDGFGLGPQ